MRLRPSRASRSEKTIRKHSPRELKHMLNTITGWRGSRTIRARLLAAALAASAGIFAAPGAATADDRRVSVDVDLGRGSFGVRAESHDHHHRGPRFEERRVRVWVEPVYRNVSDRVWVEPVYRTVPDRVWRKPEVRVQFDRVWVPDRYEVRTTTRRDRFGRLVKTREKILIEPGHHEKRRSEVVVRPGFWDTVERQEMVSEGRWDVVTRQELVSAGRWEWRVQRVRVDRPRRDAVVGFEVNTK
jgi:hypothetical protein